MRKFILIAMTLGVLLWLAGCGKHEHTLITEMIMPASCTEGEQTRTFCTGCEYSLKFTGQPLGHDEVPDWGEDPTCRSEGLTDGIHCDRCGEVFVPQEPVPMVEHYYDGVGQCYYCGSDHPDKLVYIEFRDPILENAVREELHLQSEQISQYDLDGLTSLTLTDGVLDLQDLLYARNLESVTVDTETVEDISQLCQVPSIKRLRFYPVALDLSFVADMPNLTEIGLSGTDLVDCTYEEIFSIPGLTKIYIFDNSMKNIDFLAGASKTVREIELWHCFSEHADLGVLETFPNLEKLMILTFRDLSQDQEAVIARLIERGIQVDLR